MCALAFALGGRGGVLRELPSVLVPENARARAGVHDADELELDAVRLGGVGLLGYDLGCVWKTICIACIPRATLHVGISYLNSIIIVLFNVSCVAFFHARSPWSYFAIYDHHCLTNIERSATPTVIPAFFSLASRLYGMEASDIFSCKKVP